MSTLKKILLAMLSILLIIDINLLVLAISVNETILNPSFVERELDKLNAYPRIKEIVVGNFEGNGIFTKIINDSVTESWIKRQSHTPIYNFFSYAKSGNNQIDLTVSAIEVKQNIKDNLQKDAVDPAYAPYIENEVDKIPDNINLYNYLNDNGKEMLRNFQRMVNYFYLMLYLLIAVAVIIPILSIVILKDLKSVIRFIGNSAFFSGLISYGTGILTINMVSQKFQSGEMPATIPEDIVLTVLGDILNPMKTYGIILLACGAILLILSFFINANKKNKS